MNYKPDSMIEMISPYRKNDTHIPVHTTKKHNKKHNQSTGTKNASIQNQEMA